MTVHLYLTLSGREASSRLAGPNAQGIVVPEIIYKYMDVFNVSFAIEGR